MSNYSEYMKIQMEKDEKFFFGESVNHTNNQYFKFNHVIDNDNIVINTNNIKKIKGNFVLVVDNDKAVYLKDWQIRRVYAFIGDVEMFCVKLNRKFFKPYTFRFSFEDFGFEKEFTFDDLKDIAQSQDDLELALCFMD